MDHHQGVVGHLDAVCTAGRHAASAETSAVDAGRAALAQGAQDVVDGDAVEEIAADRVEVDQHRRYTIVLCLQVADEVSCGDSPEADLAVDEDLDGLALTFAEVADAVPVLGLQVGDTAGLVEDPGRIGEAIARRQGDGQCQRQGLVLDHCSSSLPPVLMAVSVV
ncbi:hypothetical protein D9M68_505430 [compost metagenome]